MEGRLGNDKAMGNRMVVRQFLKPALLLGAISISIVMTAAPASAQQTPGFFERPVRYGNTSSFFYDNRDDDRDFRTNGVFPGNFAANIEAGSRYGYDLLWVVLLANLVAMLFQALSAKLDIVTE